MLGSPRFPWTRIVRLDMASGPGEYLHRSPIRDTGCCLPYGQTRRHSPTIALRGSTPSRSASSVTLTPRLLSCLRICTPDTARTARLDTGLVASDYPDRIPTHYSTWHCRAALARVTLVQARVTRAPGLCHRICRSSEGIESDSLGARLSSGTKKAPCGCPPGPRVQIDGLAAAGLFLIHRNADLQRIQAKPRPQDARHAVGVLSTRQRLRYRPKLLLTLWHTPHPTGSPASTVRSLLSTFQVRVTGVRESSVPR